MYTMMQPKVAVLQKDVRDLPLLSNLANLKRVMIVQVQKNLRKTVRKLNGEELRNCKGKKLKLLQSNSTNRSSAKWLSGSVGKSKKCSIILRG